MYRYLHGLTDVNGPNANKFKYFITLSNHQLSSVSLHTQKEESTHITGNLCTTQLYMLCTYQYGTLPTCLKQTLDNLQSPLSPPQKNMLLSLNNQPFQFKAAQLQYAFAGSAHVVPSSQGTYTICPCSLGQPNSWT